MNRMSGRISTAGALGYARAAAEAWRGETVRIAGLSVRVPGPRLIRLSVVGGNFRIHRLIDAMVAPGATVVDVGANVGYNTVYAASRTGRRGRVIAVEPTPDNLAVLNANLAATDFRNVIVHGVAAGRAAGTCDFYLRGETSAVNSLFPESCYATVTGVLPVPVARLDDLVEGEADLVKIDVEGGELDVLEGMPRLLRHPRLALIVEWHPGLQAMAGYAPDALPRWLLNRGWRLHAASHLRVRAISASDIPALAARLRRSLRPVELLARQPSCGP